MRTVHQQNPGNWVAKDKGNITNVFQEFWRFQSLRWLPSGLEVRNNVHSMRGSAAGWVEVTKTLFNGKAEDMVRALVCVVQHTFGKANHKHGTRKIKTVLAVMPCNSRPWEAA